MALGPFPISGTTSEKKARNLELLPGLLGHITIFLNMLFFIFNIVYKYSYSIVDGALPKLDNFKKNQLHFSFNCNTLLLCLPCHLGNSYHHRKSW